MAKFLVTYNDSVNDVEITGFVVMTEKELQSFEDLAYSINWDFTYSLDENEIEFSSGEDLLSRISYNEISNEEAKLIKKLFKDGFGVFIGEDYLETLIEEEEEDVEDEDDLDDNYNEDDDEY